LFVTCSLSDGPIAETVSAPLTELPAPGSGQDPSETPHGTVTKYSWTASRIYPGTQRDYWVYVPAQYTEREPACVMVFQDGGTYIHPKGSWNTAAVFDQLIHRREMPVTIGIFVNSGQIPPLSGEGKPRSNRSVEYDSLGDRYARFLIEEILPEVGKQYRLKQDGSSRAIAGASSGAIAAFTVAWERPDAFSRVFSTVGSYVALRDGHEYVALVRKTEHKPLRIFLQSGTNDANMSPGAWWVANQDMLEALKYAGYDVRHAWGEGGHDSKHGAAIFGDALQWLWRDYPLPIPEVRTSRPPLSEILLPGESWQPTAKGHTVGAIATNAVGDVVLTDTVRNQIYTLGGDEELHLSKAQNAGMGRMVAFQNQLFVAEPAAKRVASYDSSGRRMIVATNLSVHHLTVASSGHVYATDKSAGQVWLIDQTRRARVVAPALRSPAGVQLSVDERTLFVSDPHERVLYAYQVQGDGTLTNKLPHCYLHVPSNELDSGADGMAVDPNGRLYISTTLGVQVCDEEGRVIGIITLPVGLRSTQLAFGGKTHDVLYAVSSTGGLLRRKVQTKERPKIIL
jgi:enterochelin esterase-like enzyme/sugar lactone lactonase YvrE